MDNTQLSLVFGNQALADLSNRKAIEAEIDRLYRENDILLQQATHKEQTITGTAATCTEDGLTDGKKCSVCNTILQAQDIIPASGHSYDPESKICTLCGEKEQQPEASTPATTPSWEPIGTLPTPQSGAASSDEEVKTNPIVIVLIVAAAVTVIGGTTLVLIKKKK